MTNDLVHRSQYVCERLEQINKTAGELIIENGLLLREMKENQLYKELGYESFDECIQKLQDRGVIEYGPRQARNFVGIILMMEANGYDAESIKALPVSKLREIASIPLPDKQKALLEKAGSMTTAEVQAAAKQLRDEAHGRVSDPTKSLKVICSDTQLKFFKECFDHARALHEKGDYQFESLSDAGVLEGILAEWISGAPL